MAKKPELGIKDPYELNEDQYKAALDLLRQQHTLIQRYWHDATVQTDDFKNEGVVASGSWPYQVNLLQGEKKPIASTIPAEGRDRLGRHHDDACRRRPSRTAPICGSSTRSSPKLQGDLASWFGSVPAVPAACKGNALLTDEGCKTNGFENFDKIKFWKTPVAKCAIAGRLRALLPLGDGLHRGDRRAVARSTLALRAPRSTAGRSRHGAACSTDTPVSTARWLSP